MHQVTSGLMNDTKLKSFILDQEGWEDRRNVAIANDYFQKLLCESSNIESICNSNHTLEHIVLGNGTLSFTNELLRLIKNAEKAQVVRNKIYNYYFVGDFDVTIFTNMPVSVVPEVISRIRSLTPFIDMHLSVVPKVTSQIRSETKLSAIFWLLKCIPELEQHWRQKFFYLSKSVR